MDKFKTWPITKTDFERKKTGKKLPIISKGQNLNWRFQHCNSNTTSKSKALRVLQPLTSLYLGSVDLLQGVSFNMLAIPWSSRTRLCRWSGNGLGLPLTPCSLNHVARENPMNEDSVLYFSVVQCCLIGYTINLLLYYLPPNPAVQSQFVFWSLVFFRTDTDMAQADPLSRQTWRSRLTRYSFWDSKLSSVKLKNMADEAYQSVLFNM